jgi:hypothetical protein
MLPGAALPPLHTAHHFINLTNGLEALPLLTRLGLPHRWGGVGWGGRMMGAARPAARLAFCLCNQLQLKAGGLGLGTVVVWGGGSACQQHRASEGSVLVKRQQQLEIVMGIRQRRFVLLAASHLAEHEHEVWLAGLS